MAGYEGRGSGCLRCGLFVRLQPVAADPHSKHQTSNWALVTVGCGVPRSPRDHANTNAETRLRATHSAAITRAKASVRA
jgi:hypothetical protein